MILDIKINNCNNIDQGIVTLRDGALNIKYAINGTGKSTIARALSAKINNDEKELNLLTPYKYLSNPEGYKANVTGINSINSVMTFNENYVNQYVFKQDEVIKNSFEIFIKTPDYESRMNEIKKLLSAINVVFQNHPELEDLIKNFAQFIDGFGKSKVGYSASSAIGKGLGKGNKINNVPKGLEIFSTYLQNNKDSLNVKWIKWQIDGQYYLALKKDQCPYCSSSIDKQKENIISRIINEYDPKSIEHLNNVLHIFENLMPYFSESTKLKIREFSNNIGNITDQQKNYLIEIKNQVSNFLRQLQNLKGIGFHSLKNVNKVADELKNYIIDLSLFSHLQSEKTKSKVDIINGSLSDVMKQAGELQGELNKQKKLIQQTIEQNKNAINNFFQCAGYNYEVCIEENENQEYRMLLQPATINRKVESIQQHLSYGERNAFALVLFMFNALKKDPDLIILDDPISSFDGNKKFAIISMLFLSDRKHCLNNRTVLMLTHEFSTVIDIIYTLKNYFHPAPYADFLTVKNGVLKEKEIRKSDISSFKQIVLNNMSIQMDNLNKLIYLRRLLEFEHGDESGVKGNAWNLLSNLFHKRKTPMILNRQMTDAEMHEASKEICEYITDFDYINEYKKTKDIDKLINIYRNSDSNYEKLQIYRIIKTENKQDNVIVKKFINEMFHIENDYLFQLNPRSYDTIPQYIIDECDKEIMLIENESKH